MKSWVAPRPRVIAITLPSKKVQKNKTKISIKVAQRANQMTMTGEKMCLIADFQVAIKTKCFCKIRCSCTQIICIIAELKVFNNNIIQIIWVWFKLCWTLERDYQLTTCSFVRIYWEKTRNFEQSVSVMLSASRKFKLDNFNIQWSGKLCSAKSRSVRLMLKFA